jgi:hypothetical protein
MKIQGQLTSTTTTLWSNGTNEKKYLKTFIFYNVSETANDFHLHIVDNDSGNIGSANNANEFLYYALEAGQQIEWSPSFPIEFNYTNDSIQAIASNNNAINFIILGT